MSHFADYVRERTRDLIIETEDGFATYRYLDNGQVYLLDIYVVPEKRKAGVATALADSVVRIARDHGCSMLIGSVAPGAKNSTTSLKVLLGYGMTLFSASNDLIVFRKEI